MRRVFTNAQARGAKRAEWQARLSRPNTDPSGVWRIGDFGLPFTGLMIDVIQVRAVSYLHGARHRVSIHRITDDGVTGMLLDMGGWAMRAIWRLILGEGHRARLQRHIEPNDD